MRLVILLIPTTATPRQQDSILTGERTLITLKFPCCSIQDVEGRLISGDTSYQVLIDIKFKSFNMRPLFDRYFINGNWTLTISKKIEEKTSYWLVEMLYQRNRNYIFVPSWKQPEMIYARIRRNQVPKVCLNWEVRFQLSKDRFSYFVIRFFHAPVRSCCSLSFRIQKIHPSEYFSEWPKGHIFTVS